jgi:hypothetical protein
MRWIIRIIVPIVAVAAAAYLATNVNPWLWLLAVFALLAFAGF